MADRRRKSNNNNVYNSTNDNGDYVASLPAVMQQGLYPSTPVPLVFPELNHTIQLASLYNDESVSALDQFLPDKPLKLKPKPVLNTTQHRPSHELSEPMVHPFAVILPSSDFKYNKPTEFHIDEKDIDDMLARFFGSKDDKDNPILIEAYCKKLTIFVTSQ